MRTIMRPGIGNLRLGRTRPAPSAARKVSLRDYLRSASLPTPPRSTNYSYPAAVSISRVYLNDRLGSCVVAGGCHVRGVTSANAGGGPVLFTDADVVAMYGAIGGYDPRDPTTDRGCDEITALRYWQRVGFPDGVRLAGWVRVDATDPDECRLALYLFENLFLGVELPGAWLDPAPQRDGFTWDIAGNPDPENGHCIVAGGYDDAGLDIYTWGMLGQLTWRALAKYATPASGGELYALLSPDMVASAQAKAPNGLAWDALVADLVALGGDLTPGSEVVT